PEPDLAYVFKHIVTQDVAYNLMLFAQRRELHQSVAMWYEGTLGADLSTYYPLLAYHWSMAEVPVNAMGYLEKAADLAIRSGAYQEAIHFLNQAIATARQHALAI